MSNLIRLLDSTGTQLLDSVSGDYEDSFTLESFEDLCAHFASQEPQKSFIIARVQTWDSKQPEKSFYSYYDAYHLNKILFQTQVIMKRKYIHRLHVLNPLTNTDIIGHVEYYKVISPTLVVHETRHGNKDTNGLTIDIPISNHSPLSEIVSPSVKEIEKGQDIHWTLGHHLISSDLDGTHLNEIPTEAFPMIKDQDKCVNVPFHFRSSKPTKSNSWNITIKIPNERDLYESAKRTASPGVVTQFSVPVGNKDLNLIVHDTKKQNRILSFRNAVSASGVPASFHEWAKLIQDEKNTDDDQVIISKLTALHKDNNSPKAQDSITDVNDCVWDAILFATDDDFLSSSSVRKFFYENAVNQEEAMLFEMKEYTGEEPAITRDGFVRPPEQSMCYLM